jgi:hypothetical protein
VDGEEVAAFASVARAREGARSDMVVAAQDDFNLTHEPRTLSVLVTITTPLLTLG